MLMLSGSSILLSLSTLLDSVIVIIAQYDTLFLTRKSHTST